MKFIPVFFLVVVSVVSLHAQKIEKYYDYLWKEVSDPSKARFYSLIEKKGNIWSRQDYFIHERSLQMQGYYKDADCKVEDGEFTFYYYNRRLQMKGRYVNGKKSG